MESKNTSDTHVFKDWLVQMMDSRNKDENKMILRQRWSIWRARNETVWNQRCMDVNEVIMTAVSTLNQWVNAQDKSFDTFLGYMTSEDGIEQLRAPNADTIKNNTDATIFKTSHCYSFAHVARDHTWALIEASVR